ncbi:MAG TPA: cupredoxin domain-containing protein, partial [Nitrospiraceae bacterium]
MKDRLWVIGLAFALATPTVTLATELEMESVTVEIRSRMFIPQQIHLHQGRKTVLRFRNHDTELHTVVAKELFLSDDLNLAGNGAPEFGPEGLKKVIIPP